MPPADFRLLHPEKKLSPNESRLILTWIDQSLERLEISRREQAEQVGRTDLSAYERELAEGAQAVFGAVCSTCHSSNGNGPGGFKAADRLGALVAEGWVAPGNPEKSVVWKMIESGQMPPSSYGMKPLTAAQSKAVYDWIEAGAPVPYE